MLSRRVSSELIAIIKDFEKENRDPKYLFIFPILIHTIKWKYDYTILERKRYLIRPVLNLLIKPQNKSKEKLHLVDVMVTVLY